MQFYCALSIAVTTIAKQRKFQWLLLDAFFVKKNSLFLLTLTKSLCCNRQHLRDLYPIKWSFWFKVKMLYIWTLGSRNDVFEAKHGFRCTKCHDVNNTVTNQVQHHGHSKVERGRNYKERIKRWILHSRVDHNDLDLLLWTTFLLKLKNNFFWRRYLSLIL